MSGHSTPDPVDVAADWLALARRRVAEAAEAAGTGKPSLPEDISASRPAPEELLQKVLDVVPYRFSRIGPKGPRLPDGARKRLALAMTTGPRSPEGDVPAGFTFLAQFVGHDLTFARSAVTAGAPSPADLLESRSPRLDLDAIYGTGPDDSVSAQFYEPNGRRLRVGTTVGDGGLPAFKGFDRPRRRGTVGRGQALIPDGRNDDNVALAQTHLAFIRFHNRVVAMLSGSIPRAQLFPQARASVVKHYQWMLWNDFLPRICAPEVLDDVFTNGRRLFDPAPAPMDLPAMPIEFSVAAYRLGHSMVRSEYQWNRVHRDGDATLGDLFEFAG